MRTNAAIQLGRVQRNLALAEEAAKEIEANAKVLPDAWTAAAASGDLGRAFCVCGRNDAGSKWLEKSVAGWAALKVVPQLEQKRKNELELVNQELRRCR